MDSMYLDDEEFSQIVADALDNIPEKFGKALENTAVVIEDKPSMEQRRRLKLCHGQTLLGLFEGVPLPNSAHPHATIPPRKITIFKLPLLFKAGGDPEKLKKDVYHTVWHEVAHFFGLNHADIERLEKKNNSTT